MMPQKYYVSITSGTIGTEPSNTDQLTVQASEEELEILQHKLERGDYVDDITSLRAMIPFKSGDHDKAQEEFSDDLRDLYAYIYRIGTLETRKHIETTKILQKLSNQDYHMKGYNK
ncbi:hypothetical protein KZ483_19060 [Paenibacillus sp. sptzw28]|uniref:hypothetical protein n=1 Tax=Paenibacillus sp. sptzw28 TaxID=715179 RepID=UPI001C6F3507|nr:hypothetical protein [Paenibacillus sp. sptzw28]QYR19959.1 hypothetical protein KZ483_19060 [Paenibacillus sp. sptzw28]